MGEYTLELSVGDRTKVDARGLLLVAPVDVVETLGIRPLKPMQHVIGRSSLEERSDPGATFHSIGGYIEDDGDPKTK